MYAEWKTSLSVLALLAFSVTASAEDVTSRQVECWLLLDSDEQVVMTLPIASEQYEWVLMTMNGIEYPSVYVSEGLQHRWIINPMEGEEVKTDYQVIVDPDLSAGYYDFSGIEDDERRTAETDFQCRIADYQMSKAEEKRRSALAEVLLLLVAEEDARLAKMEPGEMTRYQYAVHQKIMRNWVQPASAQLGIECVIDVRQLPGGDVVSATVGRCNGDATVRRSIEAAVLKASPLPQPEDPNLFRRDLRITFKPEE